MTHPLLVIPTRSWAALLAFMILALLASGGCTDSSTRDVISDEDSSILIIHGRVVRIADGDTLTILTTDEEQLKIRLAEIDTPERGQPFATRAKQALSALVWPKDVAVRVIDVDRYNRIIGRIFVDELDVSAEMVKLGAAWVYRRYSTDESLYQLEAEAREMQRGLWALPETERIPPWEWRQRK